jgi:hypothetical protein
VADSIFAEGPLAAPETYIVPGASVIVPLSVAAVVDGTNASGDFVPVLIIRDQQQNVIARIPTSTTVVAGESAEVSWFPGGLTPGGSTAAAGAEWAQIYKSSALSAPQSIAGGGNAYVIMDRLVTSKPSQFAFGTLGSGNDAVTLGAAGMYLFVANASWTTTAGGQKIAVQGSGFDLADTEDTTLSSTRGVSPPVGSWKQGDVQLLIADDDFHLIGLLAVNDGGGAHTISDASLGIYYFPNAVAY